MKLFEWAPNGGSVLLHGAVVGPEQVQAKTGMWAWFWLITADEVVKLAVYPRHVPTLGPVLSGDGRVRVVGRVDRRGPVAVLVPQCVDRESGR